MVCAQKIRSFLTIFVEHDVVQFRARRIQENVENRAHYLLALVNSSVYSLQHDSGDK